VHRSPTRRRHAIRAAYAAFLHKLQGHAGFHVKYRAGNKGDRGVSVKDQAQLRILRDLRAQEAIDLPANVVLPIEVVAKVPLPERVRSAEACSPVRLRQCPTQARGMSERRRVSKGQRRQ